MDHDTDKPQGSLSGSIPNLIRQDADQLLAAMIVAREAWLSATAKVRSYYDSHRTEIAKACAGRPPTRHSAVDHWFADESAGYLLEFEQLRWEASMRKDDYDDAFVRLMRHHEAITLQNLAEAQKSSASALKTLSEIQKRMEPIQQEMSAAQASQAKAQAEQASAATESQKVQSLVVGFQRSARRTSLTMVVLTCIIAGSAVCQTCSSSAVNRHVICSCSALPTTSTVSNASLGTAP